MKTLNSALSKTVAYIADCGTIVSDSDPFFDDYNNPQPIYSQEYVSALLAELEAKGKRIAELEGQLQSGFTSEALAQEERAENAEQRVAELEAKLATPVRLPAARFCPAEYEGSLIWSETESHNKAISDCAESLRATGFTVDGGGVGWQI